MTRPDTVSEVRHLGETRSRSRKKKAVAAISAIEINQNDMPTKSSDLSIPDDDAAAAVFVLNKANINPELATAVALEPKLLIITRTSFKVDDR